MRRNPFEELEEMLDRVSRQVEEGMASGTGFPVPGSIAVDVADYDDEYVVTADLPGYEIDDIELTLSEGTLRLEAEREREQESTSDPELESGTESESESESDSDSEIAVGHSPKSESRYLRRERTHRSVKRRIRLPEPVEEDDVSASYTNGVLTVTLPKVSADEGSKQIDIE
ncbi:Hsp20/alpha crystallin family protein [Halobacteria archaeon AArc-m2/3/4]|uniref:Hsp20/alpha crystallin family protein n=1 Tax=Natronoglomus mannanivorans TaxID=2979990 RepID=A0AAP2YZS9_9EURY|nr:Hsp20/alpha crystallin family protein [Halobacteria archaeon AArc-xg1-1]MCU4971905.1 Hsp20/alpha crystallin family protein [Halobacteria archaeon AArc-m2/3/4]